MNTTSFPVLVIGFSKIFKTLSTNAKHTIAITNVDIRETINTRLNSPKCSIIDI